ncbi:MAG: dehydrogenase [Prevotella sp.]|nr:dehydrogenase [Prevotella sp.]MBQ4295442.1 dehydrogenase [Prevotella sp.]MBR7053370.1 dehydrogenase [Prevotella sp.]
MADNYLEYRRETYELRKEEWLRKKRHLPPTPRRLEKPDDEAL